MLYTVNRDIGGLGGNGRVMYCYACVYMCTYVCCVARVDRDGTGTGGAGLLSKVPTLYHTGSEILDILAMRILIRLDR